MTELNRPTAQKLKMYKLQSSITSILVPLLVAIIAISSSQVRADDVKKPADLEIHYTFKPEQCDRKAEVTDMLTLHYTGALADGKVFDSR